MIEEKFEEIREEERSYWAWDQEIYGDGDAMQFALLTDLAERGEE